MFPGLRAQVSPQVRCRRPGPGWKGSRPPGGSYFSASPGTLMWCVRGGQERFLGARGLDVADRAQSMTPGSSGHVAGASCAPRPLPPDTVTRPHVPPPPDLLERGRQEPYSACKGPA